MIEKYLGIDKKTVEVYAKKWNDWQRVYTWRLKSRETSEQINEFYENMSVEYACSIESEAMLNAEKYLSQIGDCKGLKVLDFGCGTGFYGSWLASQGAEVDFVDFDNVATKYLRWKLNEGKVTGCNFYTDIKQTRDKYDVILCLDVLEHVIKPTELLKVLTDKLERFGKILLTTPLLEGMYSQPRFDPKGFADCEHIEQAIKNWYSKKTNTWISNNFIRNGDLFTKTDLKIMLLYGYHPHTTGRFLETGFRQYANVVTPREVQIHPNGQNIKHVSKEMGIQYIVQVESNCIFNVPRGTNAKAAFYSIDTFDHRSIDPEFVKRFDYKLYAQKKYTGKDGFFVPLAADTGIYKPLRTKRIYDISFCGTVIQDALHEKRNALLSELVKNTNIYIGKDSNEWANLRYNEAHFVFNYGIADDLNMRVFEGMASGSVLLMNKVDTLHDYFEPGKHYLEYDTADDIKAHFEAINKNPDMALSIGQEAVKEIQAKHTYKHRAKEIIDILEK